MMSKVDPKQFYIEHHTSEDSPKTRKQIIDSVKAILEKCNIYINDEMFKSPFYNIEKRSPETALLANVLFDMLQSYNKLLDPNQPWTIEDALGALVSDHDGDQKLDFPIEEFIEIWRGRVTGNSTPPTLETFHRPDLKQCDGAHKYVKYDKQKVSYFSGAVGENYSCNIIKAPNSSSILKEVIGYKNPDNQTYTTWVRTDEDQIVEQTNYRANAWRFDDLTEAEQLHLALVFGDGPEDLADLASRQAHAIFSFNRPIRYTGPRITKEKDTYYYWSALYREEEQVKQDVVKQHVVKQDVIATKSFRDLLTLIHASMPSTTEGTEQEKREEKDQVIDQLVRDYQQKGTSYRTQAKGDIEPGQFKTVADLLALHTPERLNKTPYQYWTLNVNIKDASFSRDEESVQALSLTQLSYGFALPDLGYYNSENGLYHYPRLGCIEQGRAGFSAMTRQQLPTGYGTFGGSQVVAEYRGVPKQEYQYPIVNNALNREVKLEYDDNGDLIYACIAADSPEEFERQLANFHQHAKLDQYCWFFGIDWQHEKGQGGHAGLLANLGGIIEIQGVTDNTNGKVLFRQTSSHFLSGEYSPPKGTKFVVEFINTKIPVK